VAVVYGGSGAVGSAVARAFAREGAIVHLAARRPEPLEDVAREIRAAGGKAFAARADALDPDSVARHLESVVSQSGPVKIAFSAIDWGDSQGQPISEMSYQRFILPVERGLKSWFNVGGMMARHMGEHGGGVILGFTANAAREAYTEMGGFGIACAAVEHFLRHLAVENGPQGVRCCWVRSPGSPDAPGVREAWLLHARERGITFEQLHQEAASDLASSMTATLANTTGGAQVD
jgi:NAD(P)-dependent dehydrogenase (short-subunit alcohol dehydrogenase family)